MSFVRIRFNLEPFHKHLNQINSGFYVSRRMFTLIYLMGVEHLDKYKISNFDSMNFLKIIERERLFECFCQPTEISKHD